MTGLGGLSVALRLVKVALLFVLLLWLARDIRDAISTFMDNGHWPKPRWPALVALFSVCSLLTGCDAPINPVKFQPVEVLVTRPCLAGKTPPTPADTRIAVACDGKTCTMTCSDTRPEECAKHMAADIAELQREARESRVLIKECSK